MLILAQKHNFDFDDMTIIFQHVTDFLEKYASCPDEITYVYSSLTLHNIEYQITVDCDVDGKINEIKVKECKK